MHSCAPSARQQRIRAEAGGGVSAEAGAQVGDALDAVDRGGHGRVTNDQPENGASINAEHTVWVASPLQVLPPERINGGGTTCKSSGGVTKTWRTTTDVHLSLLQPTLVKWLPPKLSWLVLHTPFSDVARATCRWCASS